MTASNLGANEVKTGRVRQPSPPPVPFLPPDLKEAQLSWQRKLSQDTQSLMNMRIRGAEQNF